MDTVYQKFIMIEQLKYDKKRKLLNFIEFIFIRGLINIIRGGSL